MIFAFRVSGIKIKELTCLLHVKMSKKETQKRRYLEMAQKIFLKEADDDELETFRGWWLRKAPDNDEATNVHFKAHLALVREYAYCVQKRREEAQQWRELLVSRKSPLSVCAVYQLYNVGGQLNKPVKFNLEDSCKRLELCLQIVQGHLEGNVPKLLALFKQKGLSKNEETCRHEAAVYLATRLTRLRLALRNGVTDDAGLLREESEVIHQVLMEHAGTDSANTIRRTGVFITAPGDSAASAAVGPASGSPSIDFDVDELFSKDD